MIAVVYGRSDAAAVYLAFNVRGPGSTVLLRKSL